MKLEAQVESLQQQLQGAKVLIVPSACTTCNHRHASIKVNQVLPTACLFESDRLCACSTYCMMLSPSGRLHAGRGLEHVLPNVLTNDQFADSVAPVYQTSFAHIRLGKPAAHHDKIWVCMCLLPTECCTCGMLVLAAGSGCKGVGSTANTAFRSIGCYTTQGSCPARNPARWGP